MEPVSEDVSTWTPLDSPHQIATGAGEGTASLVTASGAYRVTFACQGLSSMTSYYHVTGKFVVSTSLVTAVSFDTRSHAPRRPASTDEILPFVYDTNWVDGATAISSVSITAYADGELDEGRREVVAVTNAVGTGLWGPAYKGLYQARIVSALSEGAAVTNTVDIDLEALQGLPDYVAAEVVLPDGTVTNCLTLTEALSVAQTSGGGVVTLKNNRNENLQLQTSDNIVFDGGAYVLGGGLAVSGGSSLAVIGGTFTTDPATYVPRGCTCTKTTEEPPTWTVSCDWQVGTPTASDVKAFLTDDGTLRVVGEGLMASWAAALKPPTLPPWESSDEAITNVAVGPLVTSIGSEAFSNCVNLVGVMLPGTVASIGRSAFDVVNAKGTATVSNGFVEVTYSPVKAGVSSPFTAKEMCVVSGEIVGGTYSYDPTAEIGADYAVNANGDGTYTVGEVWATVGDKKYTSLDAALENASDGATVTLVRGTAGIMGGDLRKALDRGVVVAGGQWLAVVGSITNGTLRCPVRLVANHFAPNAEITGGDFYGSVSAPDGSISGGTFSVRPADRLLKTGYAIVETSDDPPRSRVVKMPANGVKVPRAVEGGLVYTGENQVGVIGTDGVVYTGPTNATESGVYTVTVTPADGKTWPDGTLTTNTIIWGIAPAIDLPDGVKVGYDPSIGTEPDKGGWKLTLVKDVTGPVVIPDSFGTNVGGRVVLDLGDHTIKTPKAVQPSETNGVSAVVVTHTPEYAAPELALSVAGPGQMIGGDGADGVPAHPEGGTGASAISVAPDACVASAYPSVGSNVIQTPGSNGDGYVPGGDEPTGLPTTAIDSRDEYLALAIPYANTNDATGVTAPTLDTLVRKTELAVGDCAYVYDHANASIAKYVLDVDKVWKPVSVIEVTEAGGWSPTVGADVCTLVPGYAFWLKRGATSQANKVYLRGYKWTGANPWTVSLVGSSGKTRGRTLVSNVYGDIWDLNDPTRVDWSGTSAEGDWIQLSGEASAIYQYKGGKWVPLTPYSTSATIPAGYGFWYIRALGSGGATLTFQ